MISSTKQQLPLFSYNALKECSSVHHGNKGMFAVCYKQPQKRDPSRTTMKHDWFRVDSMETVLSCYDGRESDTWISQGAFFKPSRRVVNLWNIGLFFCDLDYYKNPKLANSSPEHVCGMVRIKCEDLGFPPPSLFIFSGQGLQIKWIFDQAINQPALRRWSVAQTVLCKVFEDLGADTASKDASRILRLVGTVNLKSMQVARVIDGTTDKHGEPIKYSFEELCEYFLPLTREQARAENVKRWNEERAASKQKRVQLKPISGTGKRSNGFGLRAYAWRNLCDLRKLGEVRGYEQNGVPEGERELHIFWRLNFMLLSGVIDPSRLYYEALALVKEICPDFDSDVNQVVSTLYDKAKRHDNGETVFFRGKEVTPLYTPRHQTLIDAMKITSDELEQMMMSTDAQKREKKLAQDRVRDEKKRREQGAATREEYLANSISKSKPWEKLGISRAKWYRMGKPNM
jgi:hypothetical protein